MRLEGDVDLVGIEEEEIEGLGLRKRPHFLGPMDKFATKINPEASMSTRKHGMGKVQMVEDRQGEGGLLYRVEHRFLEWGDNVLEAIGADEMTQPRRSARIPRDLEEEFESEDELVEEDNFEFESDEEQVLEGYGEEQDELGLDLEIYFNSVFVYLLVITTL
ncbi:hypothetical protein EZV62_007124 [Acer yangbiense]|uniref:Uncharacterized protein n=1 Tax=Acer yangbiense TaxID=1000413 RepID=A0A5C7IAT4_9ROSI|nr:hypothetical protein EZV62_007124 [Acer yangbiense]